MNFRPLIAAALSLGIVAPSTAAAQSADSESPSARGPAALPSLPSWLKLGVELRGRAESGNAFDPDSHDGYYLNRLRLNVTMQPRPWVRFFLQGQDARVFSPGSVLDHEHLRNPVDLRQAYADFGRSEAGWQVRVGRQEIQVGDERLVGADSYWDCLGQVFDAVRVGFAGTRFRFDSFTGFRVQAARRRPDAFDTSSRISGVSVQLQARGGGVVEPYLLWKRGGDTLDLRSHPGHRDVLTPGIRAQGTLPRSLDYNVEMALQRGHVVHDSISAGAGHWELGWRPLGADVGPRIGVEYNFASGDRNPSDSRHGTFDDLYPAGFNKYGISDPIAWRNIRFPAAGIEMPVTKRWAAYAGYRFFRLVSVEDGLYPGGDEYLVRNPAATSPDVGSHVLVSTAYAHSTHWRLYAGYGYIFPGAFLRQSGYLTAIRTAYLQSSFSF